MKSSSLIEYSVHMEEKNTQFAAAVLAYQLPFCGKGEQVHRMVKFRLLFRYQSSYAKFFSVIYCVENAANIG